MAGTPFHLKTHAGSWGFWAGVYGGDLRFPNEKWQGPLYAKKGEKEKRKTDWQLMGGRFSVVSVLVEGKSTRRGPITPKPAQSTPEVLPHILKYKRGNRPSGIKIFTY